MRCGVFYSYDCDGNIVRSIDISGKKEYNYKYEKEERITKVTDSVDGITEYDYDELGQLETEKVNGVIVNSMTYDGYGNITVKNGNVYAYDSECGWKDKLTSVNGNPIVYDAQGNPTVYLGHNLTWEKGRQLKSFDGNTYTYNNNGIRTSKSDGCVTHKYILDGTNIIKETWGDNILVPLYDLEQTVCGIIYNDVEYYFYKNLQGDVISITDNTGATVARYSYDAWGVPTVVSDTTEIGIASINPFRYRGYYYDSEISMYYLQSRYYDPNVGRFINSDLANIATIRSTAISTNLFTYCLNNPINKTDKMGYLTGVEETALVISGVIVAICAVLTIIQIGLYITPLISLLSEVISDIYEKYKTNKVLIEFFLTLVVNAVVDGAKKGLSKTKKAIENVNNEIQNIHKDFIRSIKAIEKTVKKNSKKRYWQANVIKIRNYKYVILLSPLTFTDALRLARLGKSIFAVTKKEAKLLAKRFNEVSGPELGNPRKCCAQYWHYHIINKKFNKQHIFFMF